MKNTMLVLITFSLMVISCADPDKCYIYVTDDRIEVPCN